MLKTEWINNQIFDNIWCKLEKIKSQIYCKTESRPFSSPVCKYAMCIHPPGESTLVESRRKLLRFASGKFASDHLHPKVKRFRRSNHKNKILRINLLVFHVKAWNWKSYCWRSFLPTSLTFIQITIPSYQNCPSFSFKISIECMLSWSSWWSK